MTSPRPTVVVTGLGATTPLGGTAEETWQAALAGRSGAGPLDASWVEDYQLPVTFAAQLATPVTEVLKKVETKRLDPFAQYALVAAREAWANAGAPEVEPERLASSVGTGIGGVQTLLTAWESLRTKGARRVYPLSIPMLMPNSAAGTVSLEFGARAGAHTLVSACSSGAESIAYGLHLIREGLADVVIAGGSEASIHPLPIAGFTQMQALSTRNDSPETASRPYDTDRDGFLLGEGGAILVLESEEHAKARGANIIATLAGAGVSADSHHIAAPEPEGAGAARAMVDAVRDAGATAKDLSHINAHATSTPVGDVAEVAAVRRAFGADADHMAISGTKSMTGHLLGAAGALEAVFAAQSVRDRKAPPTINIENLDPAVDLDIVRDTPRDLPEGDLLVLDNSFGFGGHNVALAFGSY
ncbi:beta-ketoacyl-[acyl-carrier-protein] synthase family protein [Janibacter cremeus]|uniref:3-oxoacyl-[acyl-carrier-protein] synthase 2 n=1 Tax=Janibacter cremeus TaxID=1285192 RepID=A0A852W0E1_9MICO|nr:beta-ketoacyl-[acyl-carrier-protein] synthase II [Janibacter cremeus]NYF99455.1 3-oxoacyl-[acyl-carrier-protein] synthase II [Janibacter cremeus]